MRTYSAAVAMLTFLFASLAANAASGPAACQRGAPIAEERFVRVGEIDQWVVIRGSDCANPVVLMVHGGPGNPSTPFAGTVYGPWEKDFTIVQWDQRGAGKTYERSPPSETTPLTMQELAQDGVEVAAYAARRLGKQQVILFGGSWGSALAVHMLALKPELFAAYQGSSQMVHYRRNESAGYGLVLERARAAGDTEAVAALVALGPPPWQNPRAFGIVRRITRRYEAKATEPAPAAWWNFPPPYSTDAYKAAYTAGEDYSYMQFVGAKGDGMQSRIDLPALGTTFSMPVFLIQGKEDLLTVPSVTESYFEQIRAPTKKYVLLEHVGHDPNPLMVDAQYRVLKTEIVPLLDGD